MTIDPERVEEIFTDCLLSDEEAMKLGLKDEEDKNSEFPDCITIVEGVICGYGLMTERVTKHTEEVKGMLSELADRFHGEGGSFLAVCEDRHGNQWTGEHRSVDQLVSLGIAIKAVRYLGSRKVWAMCPGGMPYLKIEGVR